MFLTCIRYKLEPKKTNQISKISGIGLEANTFRSILCYTSVTNYKTIVFH